jgi:hypothetical protein
MASSNFADVSVESAAAPPFPKNGIMTMTQAALLQLMAIPREQQPRWDDVLAALSLRSACETARSIALVGAWALESEPVGRHAEAAAQEAPLPTMVLNAVSTGGAAAAGPQGARD